MTTFKEIRGTTIEVVSSDPSNPEAGQIWYNSSSGTLKGYALTNVNAWASGGTLSVGMRNAALFGTQTAAINAGGVNSTGIIGTTQSYNGTSWSSLPATLNTPRESVNGAGTQTAGIIIGGLDPAISSAVESWNGSSWTNITSLPAARDYGGAVGTQTAALYFGGRTPTTTGTSFSYNGAAWTSGGTMNTARFGFGYAGNSNTAALAFGGQPPPTGVSATESYNGTSWTSLNNLNTARADLGGLGTQTLALGFGGSGPGTSTELWNGTSWTSNPTGLGSGRLQLKGCGTQTAGLTAGGFTGPATPTSFSEEWTGQALLVKTITVS